MRCLHRTLIEDGWASGAVNLLRVQARDRLVGILYVFVHDGRVLSYQSGFCYDPDDARVRPGLVCHVMAVEHYRARGARCYDLLAGDDRYKRTLANDGNRMHWATLHARNSARGALAVLGDRVKIWLRSRPSEAVWLRESDLN